MRISSVSIPLALAAGLIGCTGTPTGTTEQSIVNGFIATPNPNYEWFVTVYNSVDKSLCSGVMLNNQYVLTAAHCVASAANFPQFTIGVTNKYSSAVATEGAAAQVWIHPDFQPQYPGANVNFYDAAVIKLSFPFQFVAHSNWYLPV